MIPLSGHYLIIFQDLIHGFSISDFSTYSLILSTEFIYKISSVSNLIVREKIQVILKMLVIAKAIRAALLLLFNVNIIILQCFDNIAKIETENIIIEMNMSPNIEIHLFAAIPLCIDFIYSSNLSFIFPKKQFSYLQHLIYSLP